MRLDNPACLVERNVNAALEDTMAQAEALFLDRFKAVPLDALLPDLGGIDPRACAKRP